MGKVINLPDPIFPRLAEMKADLANLRVAVQIQNDALAKTAEALASAGEAMQVMNARVKILEEDYLVLMSKLNNGWTPL